MATTDHPEYDDSDHYYGSDIDGGYAMTDPDVTYPSNPQRFPGQERRIRGNIVAVVDKAANRCITFYENVVETDLRPDQIEAGAVIAR